MDFNVNDYDERDWNICPWDFLALQFDSAPALSEPNPDAVFPPENLSVDHHRNVENEELDFDELFKEISSLEERIVKKDFWWKKIRPMMELLKERRSSQRAVQTAKNENPLKRKRSMDEDSIQHSESLESEFPKMLDGNLVQIGSKGTVITNEEFSRLSWRSAATATRCLLKTIFGMEILCTHTLSGKPSPAFKGREGPPKNRLNDDNIADIIECVRQKCPGTSIREIRVTVTTQCADAQKKKRIQANKLSRN